MICTDNERDENHADDDLENTKFHHFNLFNRAPPNWWINEKLHTSFT